jgi:hypothetical protein
LGKHFFGDEEYFTEYEKYSLEPLRDLDSDTLAPGDVDQIEWIKLREYQRLFPGSPSEIFIHKSDDVFAALEARGDKFPEGGKIIRATFQVKFLDSKTPRLVTIKPPRVALYSRNGDSERIEQWLKLRGFIRSRDTTHRAKRRLTALAGD